MDEQTELLFFLGRCIRTCALCLDGWEGALSINMSSVGLLRRYVCVFCVGGGGVLRVFLYIDPAWTFCYCCLYTAIAVSSSY